MNTTDELSKMIAGTVAAYRIQRERVKALKAIQWRFRGPHGEYCGLNTQWECCFCAESQASIFDGCDNEKTKLLFWERALKSKLTIEILP